MGTNLKGNIWVEGFDTNEEVYNFKDTICFVGEELPYLYIGKTSEITEELAKECVEYYIQRCKYKNYNSDKLIEGIKLNGFNYSIQSIISACDKKYCIIYKI